MLQHLLGDIPIVGGSAGDDLRFDQTAVFCDGEFRSDTAALVLVNTATPFQVFNTQHFVPTDRRVVVTDADAPAPSGDRAGWLARRRPLRATRGRGRGRPGPDAVRRWTHGRDDRRIQLRPLHPEGQPRRKSGFYCAIENGLVLRLGTRSRHGREAGSRPRRTFGCSLGPLAARHWVRLRTAQTGDGQARRCRRRQRDLTDAATPSASTATESSSAAFMSTRRRPAWRSARTP